MPVKEISYVDSLISYVNDIKPYHSKLIETIVEYRHTDSVFVNISDKITDPLSPSFGLPSLEFKIKQSSNWCTDFLWNGTADELPFYRTIKLPVLLTPRYTSGANSMRSPHQAIRIGGENYNERIKVVFVSDETNVSAGFIPPYASANVVNGVITSVDILNPGAGYTRAPIVIIMAQLGQGALVTATLDSFGGIASVSVQAGGFGYSDNIYLEIESSAKAIAFALNGKVQSISVLAQGANFSAVPTILIEGTGTGAKVEPDDITIVNGKIVSIAIKPINMGSGYTTDPLVIIDGGARFEEIVDTSTTSITGFLKISGGTGYPTNPKILVRSKTTGPKEHSPKVINNGIGCSCAATVLPDGSIDSITVIDDKRFYRVRPNDGYDSQVGNQVKLNGSAIGENLYTFYGAFAEVIEIDKSVVINDVDVLEFVLPVRDTLEIFKFSQVSNYDPTIRVPGVDANTGDFSSITAPTQRLGIVSRPHVFTPADNPKYRFGGPTDSSGVPENIDPLDPLAPVYYPRVGSIALNPYGTDGYDGENIEGFRMSLVTDYVEENDTNKIVGWLCAPNSGPNITDSYAFVFNLMWLNGGVSNAPTSVGYDPLKPTVTYTTGASVNDVFRLFARQSDYYDGLIGTSIVEDIRFADIVKFIENFTVTVGDDRNYLNTLVNRLYPFIEIKQTLVDSINSVIIDAPEDIPVDLINGVAVHNIGYDSSESVWSTIGDTDPDVGFDTIAYDPGIDRSLDIEKLFTIRLFAPAPATSAFDSLLGYNYLPADAIVTNASIAENFIMYSIGSGTLGLDGSSTASRFGVGMLDAATTNDTVAVASLGADKKVQIMKPIVKLTLHHYLTYTLPAPIAPIVPGTLMPPTAVITARNVGTNVYEITSDIPATFVVQF